MTARWLLCVSLVGVCGCQTVPNSSNDIDASKIKTSEFHQNLSQEDQLRWLNERWNYLKSFYQRNEEPYFGSSPVDGDCEKRSLTQFENIDTDAYVVRSARILTNETGVPGLCRKEDQTHWMRLAFLVCKESSKQFDLKRLCGTEECVIETSRYASLCSRKGLN